MSNNQEPQISRSLRQRVRAYLARTSSSAILDACIETFGLFERGVSDGPFRSPSKLLDEQAVIVGANIARAMMRASTQTYERNVMATGILVCRPDRCLEPLSFSDPDDKELMVLHFKPEQHLDWTDTSSFLKFAQLVDGRNSVLLCDTNGALHGIANIEHYGIISYAWSNGAYALISTKNRELKLYDPWRHAEEPVATYDGFEWSDRSTPVEVLDEWYSEQQLLAGNFKWYKINGKEITPGLQAMEKWRSLRVLLDYLSEFRLSTILALCEHAAYDELLKEGKLVPLRPELHDVKWEISNEFGLRHMPLFRLDGAHILSIELDILGVAQRIATPDNHSQDAPGTGRAAAKHLSHLIGERGVVIKVSSDGPISVFYCGDQPTELPKRADWRKLVSRTDGPYPGERNSDNQNAG